MPNGTSWVVPARHRPGPSTHLPQSAGFCHTDDHMSFDDERARGETVKSNSELLARRQAAVARGVASATAIFADQADNACITDVEGRSYIDFVSGIGVVATGHRHPKVMAAVEQQMKRFTHTAFQVSMYESYI